MSHSNSQAQDLGQSQKATVMKKQPMRLGLITCGCALAQLAAEATVR